MIGSPPRLPAAVAGLCDDAAVFPPGLAPLADAVRAYAGRSGAWYAALVGPLVLPASDLPRLGPLLPADGPPLPVSVTLPGGRAGVADALAAAAQLRIDLRSLEVAVPASVPVEAAVAQLDEAAAGGPVVYVEIPRDDRRGALLDAVAGRYRAKFRTGGVRADLYPDEAELAASLAAAVRGLDQRRGAAARASFTSFGTCSVTDPLDELVGPGIVERAASPAPPPAQKGGASA